MFYEPYEVTYKTIFDNLKCEGDVISLECSYSIEGILLRYEPYNLFVTEKVKLRHIIEKQYKDRYNAVHPGQFRLFLNFCYLNKRQHYEIGFEKEAEEIRNIVKEFYKNKYPFIEKEIHQYIMINTNIVKNLLDGLGAKYNFLKIETKGVKSLFNGSVYLKLYLKIEDKLKDTLINKIKIDSFTRCFDFENPSIYKDDECVFSCETHEGIYSWGK